MKDARITRNTRETQINLYLETFSENPGFYGSSGVGFFDHMLSSFCVHGSFRLELEMKGDLHVDAHHTVEDVGIVLGQAFEQTLGDKSGIARFGQSYVPMDESLALSCIDISGRAFLVFDADFLSQSIGGYDTQLTEEFFRALVYNMKSTLHMKLMYGKNDHHKTEALFKSAARSIREALTPTGGGILSSKGVL
ncbi:MAG: imidazoleglycerol-phosphate dehydratase HisB [Eubacteriales bacterium]